MASANGITNNYSSVEEYIKNNYGSTTTEDIAANSSISDKDMFLQLLVTQMQYQDPLSPQDNQEFLAQMAQFTSLEQMQNMNKSMEMSTANNMVGKIVTGTNSDGDAVLGVVEGMRIINGNAYVRVGEEDILLSDITAITAEVDANEVILDYTKASYASSLVGKVVTATITTTDEEGNEVPKDVQGVVQNSKVEDGIVYVVVDDNEIPVQDVKAVTEMIPADEEILSHVSNMNTNMNSLIDKLDSLISQIGMMSGIIE